MYLMSKYNGASTMYGAESLMSSIQGALLKAGDILVTISKFLSLELPTKLKKIINK